MKIVFINGRGTYPFFNGGDGITTDTLLKNLVIKGHTVECVGITPSFFDNKLFDLKITKIDNRYEYVSKGGYKCTMVLDGDFDNFAKHYLQSLKPDIVLTQLNKSHVVVKICADLNLKVIHFVHDNHELNMPSINLSSDISFVIFNSLNTQRHYAKLLECKFDIIYPPIKEVDYLTKKVKKTYITMINPVKHKGSEIVKKLIPLFPDEDFLLVSGWQKPELEAKEFPNCFVMEKQSDMRKVYSKTKILLVPSQWEEAFGRVAPEAMINKIPVIASKVGGLPEAVGDGGILIEKYSQIDEWFSTLKYLLSNPNLQKELGIKGRKYAAKFYEDNAIEKFMTILNNVYRS